MMAVAILAEDGPLHDSPLLLFGLPAIVSAAAVYGLAARSKESPEGWAVASGLAGVVWFGVLLVVLIYTLPVD
jgi:hypothetical protein